MEVKLTESGLKLFGFSPDRGITNVHMDRAYTLMAKGYANKDKNFMALYEANQPKPEKAVVPVVRPKKEKATSRKAAVREKAVKK